MTPSGAGPGLSPAPGTAYISSAYFIAASLLCVAAARAACSAARPPAAARFTGTTHARRRNRHRWPLNFPPGVDAAPCGLAPPVRLPLFWCYAAHRHRRVVAVLGRSPTRCAMRAVRRTARFACSACGRLPAAPDLRRNDMTGTAIAPDNLARAPGPLPGAPRMLTGDRPTGRLHLGHYVGSLANRIRLHRRYESFFIIADLH